MEHLQQEFQGDQKPRFLKLQTLRRESREYEDEGEWDSNWEFFSKLLELINQMTTYWEDISDRENLG